MIKLIPNLGNKTNYVLHYRNLQLYLSLGMKLTKIHKVLRFKQSDWMKKISVLTLKKEHMLQIVLKKSIVPMAKQWKTRLVNNEKDFLKYTSKPTHLTHKIFDKNYAAIHEIKPVLTLKKPIYLGFTVLELSKWLMYDFHYNFIKKN